MVLTPISDFPQAKPYPPDRLPDSGPCAVLTLDRNDELLLNRLAVEMQQDLIVQEVWKELLPEASLLISSAISGGDIRQRFHEAAAERPCWLLVEPVLTQFPLPCCNGVGTSVVQIPNGPCFYSESLLCYYTHSPGFMTLWDTEETLQQKMLCAKDAGFLGYVYENRNTAAK